MLLHTSPKPVVTKRVFCHLRTRVHSAEQPRPHTYTKDPGEEKLCVRSTSQAGKTSGKGLCSSKLLLNELIRHWYAKSCSKERESEAGEGRWRKERDRFEIWSRFIGSQKQIISRRPRKNDLTGKKKRVALRNIDAYYYQTQNDKWVELIVAHVFCAAAVQFLHEGLSHRGHWEFVVKQDGVHLIMWLNICVSLHVRCVAKVRVKRR